MRHWRGRSRLLFSVAWLALGLLAPPAQAAQQPPPDLGWLGISIADVGEELADRLATTFGPDAGNGVLVVDVLKGGPAEQAALKRGDVIIKLDTQPIWDVRQLQRTVRAEPAHGQVILTVQRDTSQITVPVTIGAMPAEARAQLAAERFGFLVRQADERDAARDGGPAEGKVLVTFVDADSSAAQAGLRPLDVILQANAVPVQSLEDFERAVRRSSRSLALRVERRGTPETITLAVERSPQ